MDDSDTLPFALRFDTKLKPPVANDDAPPEETIAPGDAFATVKGTRKAEGLRFLRHRRQSFTLPYGYLPIPWWDDPDLLLLEYPGLFTLRLLGKQAATLESLFSDRRITWIRECHPAQATHLKVAVFRIDILRSYPSHDQAGDDEYAAFDATVIPG